MAPPTPLLDADELKTAQTLASNRPCPLKSLQQYECAIYGAEIICVPFVRMFRACAQRSKTQNITTEDGTRTWRLVEVTNKDTNIPTSRKSALPETGNGEVVKSKLEMGELDEFRTLVKDKVNSKTEPTNKP